MVHSRRGTVGGLAESDVKGVPPVAGGKVRTPRLEPYAVAVGLEIVGQMRLVQRGADRTQIVGEADAGLPARLGLAVVWRAMGGDMAGTWTRAP